jgi:rubredoxin
MSTGKENGTHSGCGYVEVGIHVSLLANRICADCGYVYDKEVFEGVYFEKQIKGFKCPQCGAPRRRFAKKVGDKVGITLDGGDTPILIFSFIGIVGVIAFGFWAANDFPGL